MPGFIDFAAVKEAVSFAQAVSLLDLPLKRQGNQWRGPCPRCQQGGDRALVVTEGRGFFCFSEKKGGDVISLAAHILDIPAKDAAAELAELAGLTDRTSQGTNPRTSRTVPESEGVEGSKLSPLSYLDHEHEMVIALGFDSAFCEEHGIGYAPRGVVRGSIAIPLRSDRGALLGYIGVQDITYLPADFQTSNVVPLKRPA
ncbi:CHC2 zinc finger domain-containing protein [Parerythrobacter lacustris]|uniref:CHC2 zinc finger domain-containing protein n=1 Tax=Parerythrobacter lacustris TaxID=2969984 RepID=A0ABT1XPA6_9SPHN|nr:CHC2 zinc finger domain-containing protein [Parerythrobacter lacustris]MCR2833493.1 CHC2 zinc finger domain-containing protein [Parerythrobacter lacustris]